MGLGPLGALTKAILSKDQSISKTVGEILFPGVQEAAKTASKNAQASTTTTPKLVTTTAATTLKKKKKKAPTARSGSILRGSLLATEEKESEFGGTRRAQLLGS